MASSGVVKGRMVLIVGLVVLALSSLLWFALPRIRQALESGPRPALEKYENVVVLGDEASDGGDEDTASETESEDEEDDSDDEEGDEDEDDSEEEGDELVLANDAAAVSV